MSERFPGGPFDAAGDEEEVYKWKAPGEYRQESPEITASKHLESDTAIRYAEGQLPEWESRSLEEHIAGCEECAEKTRAAFAFEAGWEWLTQDRRKPTRGVSDPSDENDDET